MSPVRRARFLFAPASGAWFLVAVCAAASSAHAQSAAAPITAAPITVAAKSESGSRTQSTSFPLRFIKPSDLVEQLVPPASADEKPAQFVLPPGLVRVSPDDTTRRVFVQGTPEAVEQVQTLARLLDVQPRTVRLSFRILRGPTNALLMLDDNFSPDEGSVITTVAGTGSNNQALTLHAIGDGQLFRVLVTPHINGDNSVTLSASLSEVSALSFAPHPVTDKQTRSWTRRIKSAARVVAASVPNPKNKDMAYYLEITPLVDAQAAP